MAQARYYVKYTDGESISVIADDFGHDIEAGITHFWIGDPPSLAPNSNIPLSIRTDQIRQIVREEVTDAAQR